MTTIDIGRPTGFRIGRVFGDSFAVFARNFVLCFALAAIFSALPTFLFQWWTVNSVSAVVVESPQQAEIYSAITRGIVAFIIFFVLSSILQAALTRAAIEDLNDERPNVTDCLSTALSVVLPVMGIALLVSLGAMLGMLLLIIPGIILYLRWAVAIPVQVNEKRGVRASMSRSAELTKGSRWALLGLFVIFIIIAFVVQWIVGMLTALMMGSLGLIPALAIGALVSTVWSIMGAILLAVSYVELRLIKDGANVKDLAEIFA